MKPLKLTLFLLALGALNVRADTTPTTAGSASQTVLPAPTAYRIVNQGANNNVWQRETYEPGPKGKIITHIHQYHELASGMNYQNAQGQWTPSQEIIEPYAQGAIAQQGQYQVIFANNLNTTGSIDMQTPDGKRLRSNILGLCYYDTVSSNVVLIAQIQDSSGELISSNQVLYTNAFSGVNADVRYTYKKGSFEQDVILRAQPPTPESYGLNSATTEIEVMTEYLNAPQAILQAHRNNGELDEDVSWGRICLGHGKAFDLGEANSVRGIPVIRQYVTVEGREVLLEKVPVKNILSQLAALPAQASLKVNQSTTLSKVLVLPKAPLAQAQTKPMRVASAFQLNKGYVLDYVELNTDQTNFIFQGDTTYYISGSFNVYNTTILEGGAIIKYENGVGASIGVSNIICMTGPYHPAILTAKDDNTVGEQISGSSGSPSGYYGDPALLYEGSTGFNVQYLRISYADTAINDTGSYAGEEQAENIQILNCNNAFYMSDTGEGEALGIENGLFNNINCLYNGYRWGWSGPCFGANVTLNNCGYIVNDDSGVGVNVDFTNSIFANVVYTSIDGGSTTDGSYNGFYNSVEFGDSQFIASAWPFQTVGSASFYLTNGCGFFNVGTTNLDPVALTNLATRTIYPPIVYSNVTLSTAMTFNPQAQRDNVGNPDLGYHYDPLDYCLGGVTAAANLTFTTGTAVGWFICPNTYGSGYGLVAGDGITISFNGNATHRDIWAHTATVQEGNGLWTDSGWWGGLVADGGYTASTCLQLNANFTLFSHFNNLPSHYRDGTGGQYITVRLNNCELWENAGGYNILLGATNCLFGRASIAIYTSEPDPYQNFRNCTFYGGSLIMCHWEDPSDPHWTAVLQDCAFDQSTLDFTPPDSGIWGWLTCDYDATNNVDFVQEADLTSLPGANDVAVSGGFNWQSSYLGDYYLPSDSPLINAGSVTADQIGLYHFTTQASQTPEGTSQVDIGYHYVATDTYGNPLDSDGDGIPDYIEDANGNGLVDSGETDWQSMTDPGLKVHITKPRSGTVIP